MRKGAQEKVGAFEQGVMYYRELEIKTQLDEMLTSQCPAMGMQLEEMSGVVRHAMMLGMNPQN